MRRSSVGVITIPRRLARFKARAFTLAELVVTFFIVSLLLAIILPKFASARSQARRTVCLSRERSAALALIAYANQNRDNLPPPGPTVDGTSPRELIHRPSPGQINLGVLVGDTLEDSQSLLCPSAAKANFSRDVKDLESRPVACDYLYGMAIPPSKVKSIGSLGSVAILSDNYVASNWGMDIGLGASTHQTGYNVAFTDGSAVYYVDKDQSIARERVPYDDETDNYDYSKLTATGNLPADGPHTMRIYEVWHAFSFGKPDPF